LVTGGQLKPMPPHGKTDWDSLTDVQRAFLLGLTDQRVANMWAAADDWADMSPEAKAFLRTADKEKIKQLDSALRFMESTSVIWKFLLATGITMFGLVQAWDWLAKYFTVKIK
jgi:hypothetical protein